MRTEEEEENAHSVRCALDADGNALYFSRASVPPDQDQIAAVSYKLASGICGYRSDFLPNIRKLPRASSGSKAGSHSQQRGAASSTDVDWLMVNRMIGAGHQVKVDVMDEVDVRGVKTREQLERINRALKEGSLVMTPEV